MLSQDDPDAVRFFARFVQRRIAGAIQMGALPVRERALHVGELPRVEACVLTAPSKSKSKTRAVPHCCPYC
jgi:hypothetical protein